MYDSIIFMNEYAYTRRFFFYRNLQFLSHAIIIIKTVLPQA